MFGKNYVCLGGEVLRFFIIWVLEQREEFDTNDITTSVNTEIQVPAKSVCEQVSYPEEVQILVYQMVVVYFLPSILDDRKYRKFHQIRSIITGGKLKEPCINFIENKVPSSVINHRNVNDYIRKRNMRKNAA
ncbi:hypothetical protein LOD99_5454 [Oopsacas minuta]|uniref:Uncharacterized protein n=1 Tax=Oopsacas minuta TaxID=111878 RepID=A0AAV7JQ30_9METZ|nr:hypothetical protein LOD99_5454 [Oopsacas minuta]